MFADNAIVLLEEKATRRRNMRGETKACLVRGVTAPSRAWRDLALSYATHARRVFLGIALKYIRLWSASWDFLRDGLIPSIIPQ